MKISRAFNQLAVGSWFYKNSECHSGHFAGHFVLFAGSKCSFSSQDLSLRLSFTGLNVTSYFILDCFFEKHPSLKLQHQQCRSGVTCPVCACACACQGQEKTDHGPVIVPSEPCSWLSQSVRYCCCTHALTLSVEWYNGICEAPPPSPGGNDVHDATLSQTSPRRHPQNSRLPFTVSSRCLWVSLTTRRPRRGVLKPPEDHLCPHSTPQRWHVTFPPTRCAQSKMSHCPKRSCFVIVNTWGEDVDELLACFAVRMMWTVCAR